MSHDPPWDQQVPGRRSRLEGEGSGSRKWRRMNGTKKGAPTGVDRNISDVEDSKRGRTDRGRGAEA